MSQARRHLALERLGLTRGTADSSSLLAALGEARIMPPSLMTPLQQLSALDPTVLLQNGPSQSTDLLMNAMVQQDVMRRNAQLLSLSNTAQHESAVNEAFRRGKEEAILSLLRANALNLSSLQNNPVSQAAAAPVASLVGEIATSTSNSATGTGALEALGSRGLERRKKNVPYFDASSLADPDPVALANRRTRGGVTEPFPEKLHRLLQDCENKGESDIISFYSHGRAFCIHKVERFCREVMPRYFKQSRLSSFQRQLNLYGFTRITSGPDAGGYYHELFLKGRPALVIHMRRVGVPKALSNQRTPAPRPSNTISPDFYSMGAVKGESVEDK
mmetsp:Transcript_20107/g.29838  ORF Transcript_20107/g.29838 Transcript_20107/m.29838 type:complete len:332 (-) Transcript_20107:90-1085(-)